MLASHRTQGGFDLAGNKEISAIDLGYVGLNLTRPELAKNSGARFLYIYYSDGRGLLKTDNRPLNVRTLDRRHIEIHSEGGHYIQVFPSAAGPFDVLAWGVVQQGQWGELDHHAWAWDFEGGWQPSTAPWRPWLRIGYSRTSGDNDPRRRPWGLPYRRLLWAPLRRWVARSIFQGDQADFGFLEFTVRL